MVIMVADHYLVDSYLVDPNLVDSYLVDPYLVDPYLVDPYPQCKELGTLTSSYDARYKPSVVQHAPPPPHRFAVLHYGMVCQVDVVLQSVELTGYPLHYHGTKLRPTHTHTHPDTASLLVEEQVVCGSNFTLANKK